MVILMVCLCPKAIAWMTMWDLNRQWWASHPPPIRLFFVQKFAMRCRCRLLSVKHTKAQATTIQRWVWPMLWCSEVLVACCVSFNQLAWRVGMYALYLSSEHWQIFLTLWTHSMSTECGYLFHLVFTSLMFFSFLRKVFVLFDELCWVFTNGWIVTDSWLIL